jgi:hypothetical protein
VTHAYTLEAEAGGSLDVGRWEDPFSNK